MRAALLGPLPCSLEQKSRPRRLLRTKPDALCVLARVHKRELGVLLAIVGELSFAGHERLRQLQL